MKKVLFGVFMSVNLLAHAQASYEPLRDCGSGGCADQAEAAATSARHAVPPIPRPSPVVIFVPQIIVQKNYKPVTIQDLQIKTNVIGNVATTTYEMTLHNPNQAILEAEFVFPLSESQTVAAVALDINGKMREGVVVEKAKARQTFEAVVRQGADPLLVEKTSGNQFKTRIYPFSANGTRKIRVVLEEPLKKVNGQFQYTLPLQFKQELKSFALDIEIPTQATALPQVSTNLPNFRFTRSEQVVRSHFEAQNYVLDNNLSFNIPQSEKNQVFTHAQGNQTYFYGNLDVRKQEQAKTLPTKIAVVWDSSLSGSKRNVAKEKELLKAYLQKVKNATVEFIPFHMEQGASKKVSVKNGDVSALFALIDETVYDGATRLNALKLNKITADEILLFTDGINTFDKQTKLTLPRIPVYVINSSAEYEPGLMRSWANQTYGSFINLTTTPTEKALLQLTRRPLRVLRYNAEKIKDIYPVVGSEAGENITLAGILTGPETKEVEVVFGYDASHPVHTEKFSVKAGGNNPAVARLWAIQKIQDLEKDPQGNKAKILELGQTYSIVTSGTSLLVLESAADYARYHITPPEELLSEYNRIVKNEADQEKTRKQNAWEDALSQANRVKEWWKRKFDIPKNPPQKYKPLQNPDGDETGGFDVYSGSVAVFEEADALVAGAPSASVGGAAMDAEAPRNLYRSAASARRSASREIVEEASFDFYEAGAAEDKASPVSSIKVKSWDPDTPYLKILKASKDAELYKDYLKLKTGYEDQPSFYFDVTDEFIRRGKFKEGLQVLSNITEMQLDNVELLRIAANKLIQMEQYGYAVELFEKIAQLREEDPQSFRDLAIAYWAKGDYQKAFDQFYYVLEHTWSRSNEVKQIVFVELNNLLGQKPQLKKKDLPKDLVFAMPVDIRIVLAWSTDNTDMDLHVVDPFGEECYYGHKETRIGGRYAHDFTRGFGPEEFMLKKAADGKYDIRTNNFSDSRQSVSGPTTLYLDIYTDYGRPNQKHQRVFVRTQNVKERNSIGEVVWSKK